MAETRERILETALSLFLKKSYREVTVQEIADSVGMTKGAFYYFFKNKESLYEELFNYYFLPKMRLDYQNFSHASLPEFYRDNLKALMLLSGLGEQAVEERGLTENVYLFAMDAVKNFPQLRDAMQRNQDEELASWIYMISLARGRGEISSSMSDEQLALIFIAVGDGTGIKGILQGGLATIKDDVLALWNALYEEIRS